MRLWFTNVAKNQESGITNALRMEKLYISMMQLTPYHHALNAEIVLTTRFKGRLSFKNGKGGEIG
mgnify:CR=1 FL=1